MADTVNRTEGGDVIHYDSQACSPVNMSLAKAQRSHSYIIVSSCAEGRDRMHMDSLGLIPGEAVHVLFCNFAGLVVAIKGSRLALGRSLAKSLTVRELEVDG